MRHVHNYVGLDKAEEIYSGENSWTLLTQINTEIHEIQTHMRKYIVRAADTGKQHKHRNTESRLEHTFKPG